MAIVGGTKWIWTVVGLCLVAACGGTSARAVGSPGSTEPAGLSSSTPTTSSRAASTTLPVATPADLPQFVVIASQPPAGPQSDTLTAIDRRSGRRIELAGPSKPPPPYAGRNWTLSGFDVSPDGHSVAFGVTSESNATPSAAIYLEPIDGSAAAKVIRVISGPQPYVWLERFSPDGRWLIGATKTWTVWPVGGGSPIVSDVVSPYPAQGLQWAPDGKRIALGEYYEGCCGTTSLLRFDAVRHTLTRGSAAPNPATIPGTRPWFGVDGALHVITDSSLVCSKPQDVDSSFRFGVSAPSPACSGQVSDLEWWRSTPGPQKSHTMHLALPEGVRQVAW